MLISVEEAARILGCSTTTIRKRAKPEKIVAATTKFHRNLRTPQRYLYDESYIRTLHVPIQRYGLPSTLLPVAGGKAWAAICDGVVVSMRAMGPNGGYAEFIRWREDCLDDLARLGDVHSGYVRRATYYSTRKHDMTGYAEEVA